MRPSPLLIVPLVVLTTAGLTAGAAPALARSSSDKTAPVITSVTVKPASVTLANHSAGTTAFAVVVRTTDAGGVDRVTVGLYDPSDTTGRAYRLTRTSGTLADGLWTATLSLPNTATTGAWSLRAFATDLSSNTSNPDAVYTKVPILRGTRLRSFTTTVDSGTGRLAAGGVLQHWKPVRGWVALPKRLVSLKFLAKGTDTYVVVDTTRTGADGSFSFDKIPAPQTGTWRADFDGDAGFAPHVSGARTVTVTPAPSPTPTPAKAG
jgi:hypothetical protein